MTTGEKVAVKVIKKSNITCETDRQRVARELRILKAAHHSTIAQLYEMIESKNKLYLVMEYCPAGELFDLIVSMKKL